MQWLGILPGVTSCPERRGTAREINLMLYRYTRKVSWEDRQIHLVSVTLSGAGFGNMRSLFHRRHMQGHDVRLRWNVDWAAETEKFALDGGGRRMALKS